MKKILDFFNNRILVTKCLLFLVAVVIIIRLVDIQIVHGEEYRKESESKMLRESVIEAPRGEIYDRNGVVLATNKLSYDVVIYKTDIDEEKLNSILLRVINIIEKNNDEVYTNFPMDSITDGFYTTAAKSNLCSEFKIDSNISDKEILEKLYEKFGLNDMNLNETEKFKVLRLRYEISRNIFSLFRGVTIAKDISYNSMAIIEEQKNDLNGVSINVTSKRYYPYNTLAAHLLGYVSSINSDE